MFFGGFLVQIRVQNNFFQNGPLAPKIARPPPVSANFVRKYVLWSVDSGTHKYYFPAQSRLSIPSPPPNGIFRDQRICDAHLPHSSSTPPPPPSSSSATCCGSCNLRRPSCSMAEVARLDSALILLALIVLVQTRHFWSQSPLIGRCSLAHL